MQGQPCPLQEHPLAKLPAGLLAPETRLWQVSLVLGVYVYMCMGGGVGMFLAFCMVPL